MRKNPTFKPNRLEILIGLIIGLALMTLVWVFATLWVSKKQNAPAPSPYVSPVDLGLESFVLRRLDEALFVARIKVIDIFSSRPIPNAKVTLEVALGCPEVVGVKCERPQFIETTDAEGIAIFAQEKLKEFLEETFVSLSVEVPSYERYTHEIPFGPTPIDVVVRLLGSPTAKVINRGQALTMAESHPEVVRWLAEHQESPGFGKSVEFKKPFWLVEYQDKFTCPKGYDPSNSNCVLRVKIDAQTGTVSIVSTRLGQITVKQSGGVGLLIEECGDRNYIGNTADYIIEGTVTKVDSQWNEERTSIFTYTNLRIEKYVKGSPFTENNLQIIIPGGTVGEISQWAEDQPIFHEGQRVRIYFKEGDGEFLIVCGQLGVEEIQ